MPSVDDALDYIKTLPRFWHRALTRRHRVGFFIPQLAIPLAKRADVCKADKINKTTTRVCKSIWIEVETIKSEQLCLRIDRLRYHVRNYAAVQRAKGYPGIIMVGRVPVLWDGNHRVTAALLLGKKFMRCDVFFPLSNKNA